MRKKIRSDGIIYYIFKDSQKQAHFLTFLKDEIVLDDIIMNEKIVCSLIAKLCQFMDYKNETKNLCQEK